MNKDCTLFLSTYDDGRDLWEGFFKGLSCQWPEMDMQIVLNTESESYEYSPYEIISVHQERKSTWAERIVHALQQVKTPYILLFLEDFWLKERVDDAFFRRTIQWMKENSDVANFSFYPCLPGENIQDGRFERFERRPQKCRYKFNCQVGLWRTTELIGFFRKHEDPWEWEILAPLERGDVKKNFYSLMEDAPFVFVYGDNLKGCIVRRGKWVEEEVLPLAEKYGLVIDYSKRGFYDFSQEEQEDGQSFIERIKKGHLIIRGVLYIKRIYHKWLSIRVRINEKEKEMVE